MIVVGVVLAVALAMMLVEARSPGRNWPRVPGWWARALALNAGQAAVAVVAGWAWDGWMEARRPWSADALGPVGGAVAGYVAMTFAYYWWHRWRHQSPLLWRVFHQVHHSPQRIEILTSFYKHPAEVLANGLLSSAIVYMVVGLGPEAAVGAVALSGLAELVYHWNVRTPHWLGYFVQRPESHCVHHQAGVHSSNYSDLPMWDMLFGTFRNPRSFDSRCGFGEDEHRLGAMLAGVDLTTRSPVGGS
jgi:sterol desaturase/sphingolipid hydroxylase (fatty acid hydroxylase superfamily)